MKAMKILLGALVVLMALAGIVAAQIPITATVSDTTNSISITPPATPDVWALTAIPAQNPNTLVLGSVGVTSNDNRINGWEVQAEASGHLQTTGINGQTYILADPLQLTCPTLGNNYYGSGGSGAAVNLGSTPATVALGVAAGTFFASRNTPTNSPAN